MAISSMTGFARIDRAIDDFLWNWELKGVNGRNLDVRCRLPAGYESLEGFVRASIAERLKRGNITASLTVRERQPSQAIKVNESALLQIEHVIEELRVRLGAEPPRLDGILALRGVLEFEDAPPDEAITAERLAGIRESFLLALSAMMEMRLEEGATLAHVISGRLGEVETLRQQAAVIAETQSTSLRDRLSKKIAELLPPIAALSEERLAQEVALLAQRADVREELDRLAAHVAAATKLLAEGGAVGRKFDFLCQEFNREANTLCSKADDLALTGIGIELKAVIDQLREQVQNIE